MERRSESKKQAMPADDAMRLVEEARALPLAERGAILERAARAASDAFASARGGEKTRAAAIAANARYQLSFTTPSRVRALAWLRLARRAGLEAAALARWNAFAGFHGRMFAAQAMVRAGAMSPWRRRVHATEILALFDAEETLEYPLAPLFRLAIATAMQWAKEHGAPTPRADLVPQMRLVLLEQPMHPSFEKDMPVEAAEIAMLAARERLRMFEASKSGREHARAIAWCLRAFFRVDTARRVGGGDELQLARVEHENAITIGRAIAQEPASSLDPQSFAAAVDAARTRRPRVLQAIARAVVDTHVLELRRSLARLDVRLAHVPSSGPLRAAIVDVLAYRGDGV